MKQTCCVLPAQCPHLAARDVGGADVAVGGEADAVLGHGNLHCSTNEREWGTFLAIAASTATPPPPTLTTHLPGRPPPTPLSHGRVFLPSSNRHATMHRTCVSDAAQVLGYPLELGARHAHLQA